MSLSLARRLLALLTCTLLFGRPYYSAQHQTDQSQAESPSPLDVHLTKPLQWQNGCLSVGLDRTNRSSSTIYIPVMGLYISSSASEVAENGKGKRAEAWINVFGASDILSWDAKPLAPGGTIHEHACLRANVGVVSLKRNSYREIPVSGRLKIQAYYYLTEKDWQKNKARQEATVHVPPEQWKKLERQDPSVISIFSAIPCRDDGCKANCSIPPLIIHGEERSVPDIWSDRKDWNERGKAISEKLAKNAPTCPGDSRSDH